MKKDEREYLVEKIERLEQQLRNYQENFFLMMMWFKKNRRHLKKLPVSRRIKLPGEK